MRDDHDSTKKMGQIGNFEAKLNLLNNKHQNKLYGIMYFIDPELSKNKTFYQYELNHLSKFYNVKLYLFYGKELFESLGHPEIWDTILTWLKQWKESLSELPEINLDTNPEHNFEEIKAVEIDSWRRLLTNNKLWEEGIIKSIFREGKTLRLLLKYFNEQSDAKYNELANMLREKIDIYYAKGK
ncbi:MAG TPA: hypothetical protein P5545_05285 [Bacteroidota bacterium]|nr:hypothetical protein [Candidatus Kapabacteria bacterium]HRS01945.1 hypothetical protein [Bacteroidota bacterium]